MYCTRPQHIVQSVERAVWRKCWETYFNSVWKRWGSRAKTTSSREDPHLLSCPSQEAPASDGGAGFFQTTGEMEFSDPVAWKKQPDLAWKKMTGEQLQRKKPFLTRGAASSLVQDGGAAPQSPKPPEPCLKPRDSVEPDHVHGMWNECAAPSSLLEEGPRAAPSSLSEEGAGETQLAVAGEDAVTAAGERTGTVPLLEVSARFCLWLFVWVGFRGVGRGKRRCVIWACCRLLVLL